MWLHLPVIESKRAGGARPWVKPPVPPRKRRRGNTNNRSSSSRSFYHIFPFTDGKAKTKKKNVATQMLAWGRCWTGNQAYLVPKLRPETSALVACQDHLRSWKILMSPTMKLDFWGWRVQAVWYSVFSRFSTRSRIWQLFWSFPGLFVPPCWCPNDHRFNSWKQHTFLILRSGSHKSARSFSELKSRPRSPPGILCFPPISSF